MPSAAQRVLPILIQGEYRAGGSFGALATDLTAAKVKLTEVGAATAGVRSQFLTVDTVAQRLRQTVVQNTAAHAALSTQAQALFHASRSMAEGLALGISPSQILLSQLNHLTYAASGPGGLSGAFKELKAAGATFFGGVAAFVNPVTLVAAGLIAAGGAAYLLYRSISSNIPDATKVLEDHKRIIDEVKDAYRNAKNQAGLFHDEVKGVLILEATHNLAQLQDKLHEFMVKFRAEISEPIPVPDAPLFGDITVENVKYSAFKKAIDELNASIESGTPNAAKFREQVAAIALADPALRKIAIDLLASEKPILDLSNKIKELRAGLDLLTGKGGKGARDVLGLSTPDAKHSLQDLIDKTKDQIEEYKFEAQAAGEAGRAVQGLKLMHDLERAAKRDGIAIDEKKRASLHSLVDEYVRMRDAVAAANLASDTQFQTEQLGRTPIEAEIAATFRSAKLDVNTAQGEMLAAQMRLNAELAVTKDVSKDVFKTVVDDLRAGKNAGEIFVDVLGKIASKIEDIAADQLTSALFKGGANSIGAGFNIFKLLGFAGGGEFQVGGSGGTDSQVVAFRASPDETVKITKPGQGKGGATVQLTLAPAYNFPSSMTAQDRALFAQMIAVANQQLAADVPGLVRHALYNDADALTRGNA